MDRTVAFSAMATVTALLIAGCGGGSTELTDGGSGSGSSVGGGGSTQVSSSTGESIPSGGSVGVVTETCRADAIVSSFDAPMLYLAKPGPITATLLAAPPPDSVTGYNTGTFVTGMGWIEAGKLHSIAFGITSDSPLGTVVTTPSLPAQPSGMPLIVYAAVYSGRALWHSWITTGWKQGQQTCCDEVMHWPARIAFGPDNTAIVSFGGAHEDLPPRTWDDFPLRIALTNVTSDGASAACTAK